VLLIAAASAAQGQTTAVDDVFGFPSSSVIACRPVVPPSTDPAAYVFQFLNGEDPETQRMTLVEFDSAGKPLQLVTWLPNPNSTPPHLQVLVVNFPPPTKGVLTVAAVPDDGTTGAPGSAARDTVPPRGTDLTPAQMESARRLAGSFWDHRCKDIQ
jgi:hypothetical protein